MAFGPMSVGSEGAFSLITDQTLTKENVAADAKAAGDALVKKFDKTGGTLSGPLKFPSIGKSATSRKIGWSGEEDGAEVYLQTDAAGRGTLIWNLLGAASGFALALNGAMKSWFGSDGSFHGNVVGKAEAAGTADSATRATSAASADTAANATNAKSADLAKNATTAANVGGYSIQSRTSDPGAGSALTSGVVLLVYE